MKTTSCGILVCNAHEELLLCHATGTPRWDIPKGQGEAGETPVATALRETAEETGLVFQPEELLELGRFTYRPQKDLWLFAALTERFETSRCHCRTQFRDRSGRLRAEMDGFAWTPFATVPARCAPNMALLLTQRVSLPDTLAQLHRTGRLARPL
ncbi:MAG TPA: NUDIX domain-containing protein [Albitalea sp.]